MEHLYCRCLNVIINVKSSANRSLHGRDLLDVSQDQDDDDFEIDEFFADEIYEVELGFSGIELVIYDFTHEYLRYTRNTHMQCHRD